MPETEFNYRKYFNKIKPAGEKAVFNRFLFAFLSVHTSWVNNVRAYEMMKGKIDLTEEEIEGLLKRSGVGLHKNRTRFLSKFSKDYRKRPEWYLKRRTEKWTEYRDRLEKQILGLGMAKSSFAIELIYPNAAWVTCIDVHIARLCKENPNLTKKTYLRAEQKLVEMAKEKGVMPSEFRWNYWDRNQGYKDPRYWSYCLESEVTLKDLVPLALKASEQG